MTKQKFEITGMTCTACSAHVERAVRKLPGVESADVSLMSNSMVARYDERAVTAEEIVQAVRGEGYGAALPGGGKGRGGGREGGRRSGGGSNKTYFWTRLMSILPVSQASLE